MNILQDSLVQHTITNFPLDLDLYDPKTVCKKSAGKVDCYIFNFCLKVIEIPNLTSTYDLTFLLAVFDQILAPEAVVQPYRFPKCGALALTIVALTSSSAELREAACHVLLRYYQQVEARTRGKDNVLWLRLIEAICKGAIAANSSEADSTAKINSFAGIFFARAALILSDASDPMYSPICQYLGAKDTPNLKGIPEVTLKTS